MAEAVFALSAGPRPSATKNWAGPASFPFGPASFSSFSCLKIFKDEFRASKFWNLNAKTAEVACTIALMWLPLGLTDNRSTLVKVMVWCCQATSYYLSQSWPSSMLPYGITWSQWLGVSPCLNGLNHMGILLTQLWQCSMCDLHYHIFWI